MAKVINVTNAAKEKNVSRSAIYQNKDNFDWTGSEPNLIIVNKKYLNWKPKSKKRSE